MPDIDGARIVTLSPAKTRKISSYAGKGHLLETYLAVFPQRSGDFTIPSASMSGAVMNLAGERIEFSDLTDPIRINVQRVSPVYEDRHWLVASDAEMTETWSKPPEELRVGDTVRREVSLKVIGVTAEQLADLEHGRTRGVSVAEAGFESRTDLTPEGAVAHLRQSWDLRIDSDSVIFISPVRMAYWNPDLRKSARASVPAKRIEPLPRDVEALTVQLMAAAAASHERRRTGMFVLAAAPLLVLFSFLAVVIWTALPTRADRKLRRLCAGNPSLTDCYHAVLEWAADSLCQGRRCSAVLAQNLLGGDAAGLIGDLQEGLYSAGEREISTRYIAAGLVQSARRMRLRNMVRGMFQYGGRIVGQVKKLPVTR